jgi:Fe-coproporphyrin III synthase
LLSLSRLRGLAGFRDDRPWPLRLLVLALGDRCDQRCAHCAIWSATPGAGMTRTERLQVVGEALALGVRRALLTGGEPLLSPDFEPVAEALVRGGASVLLATNGRLIAARVDEIVRFCAEIYVSLDGATAESHDRLRGVPSLGRVAQGLATLRTRAPRVKRVARCTLHAGNIGELEGVVRSARHLGFDHVSFLPLDASSSAFGAQLVARQALVPSRESVQALEDAITRLEGEGAFRDGFVLESPARLRRLVAHLRASGGHGGGFTRPACDAPWWSLVVEADGAVRPCFFQPAVGNVRDGLAFLRASGAYGTALRAIEAPNATCERCVCPNRGGARAWAKGHA